MLNNAEALVREYDMLPPGGVVLCAVSGGTDSMCLLHWLYRRGLRCGFTVAAAHFNHRLRGAESQRDEAFVRDFVSRLAPPHHRYQSPVSGQWEPLPPVELIVGSGDVAAQARQRRQGVEETARQLRYAFLYETADRLGAQVIATAHNADDNAETVLMDLLRGAGLQGLTGISPRRDRLIRPLLTTSRAEILEYLDLYDLPHVEDSSNQTDDFLRNKIRHQLVPLLEEWNPGFVERMTASIPALRSDNDFLNAQARPVVCLAVAEGDDLVLPVAPLAGLPDPVAIRAVRQLLGRITDGDTDCTRAHLQAMVALARSDHPSGEVHLPQGLTVRREYDRLVFTRGERPRPLAPFTPHPGENPIPGTGWALVLNADPWPGLVVRSRQTGDRMALPNGHTRTLKELLIDRKVPRWGREHIPVCADQEGVLAVAGLGPNPAHPKHDAIQFIRDEENEK